MTTLTNSSPVAKWASEHPQTSRVFEELQIDYCCGGEVSLSDACAKKQLDVNIVADQLKRTVTDEQQPSTQPNWLKTSLAELCDHIQETHHAYLREELPRLNGLVEKVVAAHGAQHAELRDLQQVFTALRAELEPHMMKEEQILFPAIRHLEQAANRPSFPFGTVANPIHMMEHEHDVAGNALARIRELTHDYLVPEDACNTYRVMLDSLQKLEQDTHQHIHKENNILFPRAQELETSRDTSA